jgi:predicted nucleic acid-binding protein
MARAAMGSCCLTLQSISEFYAVATRKGILRPAEAVPIAEAMLQLFPTATASATAVRIALSTAAASLASYWDAVLIATAAEAGCTAILSEDLSDGLIIAGVRIINPFGGAGLSPAAQSLLGAE